MPPVQAPAARLGEWLDWPRAVVLSRALDGPAAADDDTGPDADADADDCTRVREDLAQAIAADRGQDVLAVHLPPGIPDPTWRSVALVRPRHHNVPFPNLATAAYSNHNSTCQNHNYHQERR